MESETSTLLEILTLLQSDPTTLSDVFTLLFILGTAISLFMGIQAGQTR